MSAELRELQRQVAAIQAELDRRDVEQMELEAVVEFLVSEAMTFRICIDMVNSSMFGPDDTKYCGKLVREMLYPHRRDDIVPGFREGPVTWFRRPRRRWAQFGSMAKLLKIADDAGVRVSGNARRGGRQWVIRELWKHGVLPGGVN